MCIYYILYVLYIYIYMYVCVICCSISNQIHRFGVITFVTVHGCLLWLLHLQSLAGSTIRGGACKLYQI